MATDNFPVVDDVPSGNGFVGEPPDDQLDGIPLIVHKRWCIVSGKPLSTFGGTQCLTHAHIVYYNYLY